MAHTPNCMVKLDATSTMVIGSAMGRISSSGAGGGAPHSPTCTARALK